MAVPTSRAITVFSNLWHLRRNQIDFAKVKAVCDSPQWVERSTDYYEPARSTRFCDACGSSSLLSFCVNTVYDETQDDNIDVCPACVTEIQLTGRRCTLNMRAVARLSVPPDAKPLENAVFCKDARALEAEKEVEEGEEKAVKKETICEFCNRGPLVSCFRGDGERALCLACHVLSKDHTLFMNDSAREVDNLLAQADLNPAVAEFLTEWDGESDPQFLLMRAAAMEHSTPAAPTA